MDNSNVTLSTPTEVAVRQVNPSLYDVVQLAGPNDNFVKIIFFKVPETTVTDPTKEFDYLPMYRKQVTLEQAKQEIVYLQKWLKDEKKFDDKFDVESNLAGELFRAISDTRNGKITGFWSTKLVRVPNSAYKG